MGSQNGNSRYEKRFRIDVRFDGTNFVLLNGKPLPAIAKDSVAQLVLAPECILDSSVRANLSGQKNIRLRSGGSSVLLGVSPTMVESHLATGLIPANAIPVVSSYLFVETKLEADLLLQVRGDREAKLLPCCCTIPALKMGAQSVNHAFMIISEAFEKKRRSHSGNVFDRAYAQDDSGTWISLDELRVRTVQRVLAEPDQLPLICREDSE
jgi:hypothetical protein